MTVSQTGCNRSWN